MTVGIDEAGSHSQTVGVHFPDAVDRRKVPNLGDAALGDGDIGAKRGSAGPVDNGTAADDQVGFHRLASIAMARRRPSVASRSMVKPLSTSPETTTP